jgi:hypothetical protein
MSKKQPELTPLYPRSAKPARVGVYQHEFTDTTATYFSLWNGKFWCANRGHPQEASSMYAKSQSAYETAFKGWRGLTQNPRAVKP